MELKPDVFDKLDLSTITSADDLRMLAEHYKRIAAIEAEELHTIKERYPECFIPAPFEN